MTPVYTQPKAAILGLGNDAYPVRLSDRLGDDAPAELSTLGNLDLLALR